MVSAGGALIGSAGPTPLWYAARSSGYVSLLLLTAILALGVLTSLRWSNRDWPRFVSQALHRNLSLLVLVFLLIHIVTSVVDPFAGISFLNTVAPFTGSYRPIWLGLGVVSMELLVALTVTSLLRRRLSFTAWRVVHWTAYGCWPLAVLHTLGTGSDVRSGWAVFLTLGCVGVVVLAVVWRLFGASTHLPDSVRVAGFAALTAATIALLGFAAAGPLHTGWARAAGTPDRLLAATGGGDAAAPPTAAPLPTGLTDQLSGTLLQGLGAIEVRLTDARDPLLRITLTVAPRARNGQLTITDGAATVCIATASLVQDVVATCGQTSVDISLTSEAGNTVAGQIVTRPVGQ